MVNETMTLKDHAITGGLFETISRHGDAGAEFLKGLRGIDYETGQVLNRGGLRGFAASSIRIEHLNTSATLADKHQLLSKETIAVMQKKKLNFNDFKQLEEAQSILKQLNKQDKLTDDAKQAFEQVSKDLNHTVNLIKRHRGYSGEVAYVADKNANAIINGEKNRFTRSEDVSGYKNNDTMVDVVERTDRNKFLTGQMKVVNNPQTLIDDIAAGESRANDYSRYLSNDKLILPDEQVEAAKDYCRRQSKNILQQADALEAKGEVDKAIHYRKNANNYQELEHKIESAGLDVDDITINFLEAEKITVRNIMNVSHRAGIEGAKFGSAIGGGISLITNMVAVYSGDKELGDALTESARDTLISGGVGYGMAFTGTAAKIYMQQSSSQMMRGLSQTGLPAAIVSVCMAAGKSVVRYAKGEINEAGLIQEMGLTASGMLSASMFTMIGQVAIPIPVLGGLIGGMVGYALTNTFYQSFFSVLKEAELSAERRQIVEMKCAAAIALAQQYENGLNKLFAEKLAELAHESQALFSVLDNPDISADDFCSGINHFAEMLGKKISINNMADLDVAMLSHNSLKI